MSARPLTEKDRSAYRQQLRQLVERLSRGVAQLESEAMRPTGTDLTTAGSPEKDPVSSSSEADEIVARALLQSEEQILLESRAALDRIESGQYGKCERCNRVISRQRLDALPYTRLCISCARASAGST